MSRSVHQLLVVAAVAWSVAPTHAEPIAVRHREGLVHGFLVLRTLAGEPLADGDLIQTTRGDRVTSRLVFRFKDGSLHDETAVFVQRQYFRLVSSRLVQKGPAFPRPIEMSIDVAAGRVTVHSADDDGKAKVESKAMSLPTDLSNGHLLTLLKNVRPEAPPKSVSLMVATPAPRIVKLQISSAGQQPFSTGGIARRAIHYVIKIDIGGLAGLLAPLLGKQPPDSHVWVLGGEAPAFVKSEQTMFLGAPLWRVELVHPEWPKP